MNDSIQPPIFNLPYAAPSSERFSRGLKFSIIFHSALISLLFVQKTFFPHHVTPYVPTLRVDLVGLPDLLKKDMEQMAKNAGAKAPEIKEPDVVPAPETQKTKAPPLEKADPQEMVLKPKVENDSKRKEKMQNALARIKALSRFAGDESPVEATKAPPLIKGNKISHGTSLSGEARENANPTYYDAILDKLRSNWELPLWLSRQNLSAQIVIFIDSYGKIRGMEFTKASGSSPFDESVKRTIMKSQPFPPPPENMRTTLLSSGVLLGFPL